MMATTTQIYEQEGQISGEGNLLIGLVVGVGAAVLVLIIFSTIAAKAYSTVFLDINKMGRDINAAWINDGNSELIKTKIFSSITSGTDSLSTTASFIVLIVLAVVAGVILSVITRSMGGGAGGGGAGAL